MDTYFENVTRDSLQAQLRSSLLQNNDSFVAELRQAADGQGGRLFDLLSKWSVIGSGDDPDAKAVWTHSRFSIFVHKSMGDEDEWGEHERTMVDALWDIFCYSASYPFGHCTTTSFARDLDFSEWIHALALLVTDAASVVGQNGAGPRLSQLSANASTRKDRRWRRFFSLAIPPCCVYHKPCRADHKPVVQFRPTAESALTWQPPTVLDEVAKVALTQLPLDMLQTQPPKEEIMARVQKLIAEPVGQLSQQTLMETLSIPYKRMMALILAVLQVREPVQMSGSENGQSHIVGPYISMKEDDRPSHIALAMAILGAYGVDEGTSISFAQYCAFVERPHTAGNLDLSFDSKLTSLWRALFFPPDEERHIALIDKQYVSPDILHSLDLLYPTLLNAGFRQSLEQATLTFTANDFEDDTQEELIRALSVPHGPKIVVIRGVVESADSPLRLVPPIPACPAPRAVFVLTTSAPLWRKLEDGEFDDFVVGENHCLFQLEPQARALVPSNKQAIHSDLVAFENFGEVIFGDKASPHDSSLDFRFCDGMARMRSHPSEPQIGGYVEVPVGSTGVMVGAGEEKEKWWTIIELEKLEVYTLPGGAPEDLSRKREDVSDEYDEVDGYEDRDLDNIDMRVIVD